MDNGAEFTPERTDGPAPGHLPNPIRLAVDAFRGLPISIPERVQAILSSKEMPVLTPGPCQSEHSLAAALGLIGCADAGEPARIDPSFSDVGKPTK